MSVRNLKPGDRVTVRWNGIDSFTTATEVGKRKIKTADGREWSMNGRRWGSSDIWTGPWIDPYKPEDDQELAEQREERELRRLASEFGVFGWRQLPLATLRQIKAIVTAALPAPAQEKRNG